MLGFMFDLNHCHDWLRARSMDLPLGMTCAAFKDGRSIPELASNPSVFLDIDAGERVGYIGFWQSGHCDFDVIDTDGSRVDGDAMLEATAERLPELYQRYIDALNGAQKSPAG